jgi:hypothetical protein
MLRYVPESRSSPRVVTRKMAIEKLNINYKTQKYNLDHPQINNHKKNHEL